MESATPSSARYGTFCSLDFETADYSRSSACALAVVRVERNQIVDRWSTLIRPPSGCVHPRFTDIHGITTQDVRHAPDFSEAWKRANAKLRSARFIAAHNASFDASVLEACADLHEIPTPRTPFLCTVRLARHRWGIRPTRLPDVAAALGLDLNHHDALSDALACANIVTAWRRGTGARTVRSESERNQSGV